MKKKNLYVYAQMDNYHHILGNNEYKYYALIKLRNNYHQSLLHIQH